MLVVLISVAYLSATPIPQPTLAGQTTPPPSNSQTVDGYAINTTITPGGPGINTYDVEIEKDGQPVDGLAIYLRMSEPARDAARRLASTRKHRRWAVCLGRRRYQPAR